MRIFKIIFLTLDIWIFLYLFHLICFHSFPFFAGLFYMCNKIHETQTVKSFINFNANS